MNKLIIAIFTLTLFACDSGKTEDSQADQEIPVPYFLQDSTKNQTPTYWEVIDYWERLSKASDLVEIEEFGMTDKGLPLHLVHLGSFNSNVELSEREKPLLLINNAIHPGEPDGVDACMLVAYDLLRSNSALLREVDIRIIPIYNVGGALNRNSASRANQNGPAEYGFRGNAQNLDLNRDFVKLDSRNAFSFAELIDRLDPDFYVETHVSNGADYKYVMTYLASQEDKLDAPLGDFMRSKMNGNMVVNMANLGFEMVPYVNVHGVPPDDGYSTFYDSPRFSTGLLSLLQTPGYITETHMLKPVGQRVEATRQFIHFTIKLLSENATDLLISRELAREHVAEATSINLDWEVDHERADSIGFEGYEAKYKESPVSGAQRLYYDRESPWGKVIPYYAYMNPANSVNYPHAYILKRGYFQVEERLAAHGVQLDELSEDTVLQVEVYYIDTFSTGKQPYEAHYGHYNTRVRQDTQELSFQRGDLIVGLKDHRKRLIAELLEPEAPDSYFNWNYFDAILQQKEWYSPYVFEDKALDILESDSEKKEAFDRLLEQEEFANSPRARIHWVYMHSEHYEPEHLRYPVFRIIN